MAQASETGGTLSQDVVSSLLENFDCQPVLFVGAGLARRYIGAPDWEGALRYVLGQLPEPKVTYEYLSQKFSDDRIMIGAEISDLAFEWAWGPGKSQFAHELFAVKDKAIFLKSLLADYLKSITPKIVKSDDDVLRTELDALRTIRPHAIITTNYDDMLERLFEGYESIIGNSVLRYNLNAYGEVYIFTAALSSLRP